MCEALTTHAVGKINLPRTPCYRLTNQFQQSSFLKVCIFAIAAHAAQYSKCIPGRWHRILEGGRAYGVNHSAKSERGWTKVMVGLETGCQSPSAYVL